MEKETPEVIEDTTTEVVETPVEEVVVEALPEVVAEAAATPVSAPYTAPQDKGQARGGRNNSRSPRGPRKDMRRERDRTPPEFETKMISIRRVTRVVSGGRRFSLSVAVVAGDRKGRVGLGTGKALDTQVAIEKASKDARKHMIHLKLTKKNSIPFDVNAKYQSAKILLRPNGSKGLIAGSSARSILALAGVSDVTAKFNSGTKNKLNNARATMKALEAVAYARGSEPVKATKVEAVVPEVK